MYHRMIADGNWHIYIYMAQMSNGWLLNYAGLHDVQSRDSSWRCFETTGTDRLSLAPTWPIHIFLTVVDAGNHNRRAKRPDAISLRANNFRRCNVRGTPRVCLSEDMLGRQGGGSCDMGSVEHGGILFCISEYCGISAKRIRKTPKDVNKGAMSTFCGILKRQNPRVAMPVVYTMEGYVLHTLPGMQTCFCVPLTGQSTKTSISAAAQHSSRLYRQFATISTRAFTF